MDIVNDLFISIISIFILVRLSLTNRSMGTTDIIKWFTDFGKSFIDISNSYR